MIHTVKRAIVLAAGIGQRMRPLTLSTPKPLIRVRGRRFIDSIIGALHQNGIHEIYVVTGHLKEQFQSLPAQYPGLRLIENPDYQSCNNISSLYAARHHLEEAIILDGDQLIEDASILSPRFEHSGYNCVWTDEETKEWLLTVEDGFVTACSRSGGRGGWQLFSVSRWTAEDGRRLRGHLEQEFERRKNRQIYWDDVALFCHPEDYRLTVWPMQPGSVIEIDSLEELAAADAGYQAILEEKKSL